MRLFVGLLLPVIILVLVSGCRALTPYTVHEAQDMAQINVAADPRVELVCIIKYLSGTAEGEAFDPEYKEAVTKKFASFAEHPAVRMAGNIGISSLVSLAVYLDNAMDLKPVYADKPEQIHIDDVEAFLSHLRDFATASAFLEFYGEQRALYRDYELIYANNIAKAGLKPWMRKYFGRKFDISFQVVPAPLLVSVNGVGPFMDTGENGRMCYAIVMARPDMKWWLWQYALRFYILHECLHSYINPLLDRHYDMFKSSAEAMYPLIREDSWYMTAESLIHATVGIYFREHPGMGTRREVASRYPWVDGLIETIQTSRRNTLDWTFEKSLPDCAAFFEEYCRENRETIEGKARELEAKGPKIVETIPAPNATDVDPFLKISIRFDRKMNKKQVIKADVPGFRGCRWDDSGMVCTFEFDLQPDMDYNFSVNGFYDADGFQSESLSFKFRTAKVTPSGELR